MSTLNNTSEQEREDRLKRIKSLKARSNIQRDMITRIADNYTEYFGSARFLIINIIVIIAWIVINSISGTRALDPFPFVFLITIVSLEAIILAVFVLISQNRQTQIADLREEVALQIALKSQEQNIKILKMLEEIETQFSEIGNEKDNELKKMERKINPERIAHELEDEIKREQ